MVLYHNGRDAVESYITIVVLWNYTISNLWYANLIADIESKNFKVNYYTLEIGWRGYISPENQNRVKHFIKGLHNNNKYSQSH